jgi:hypothetical protein
MSASWPLPRPHVTWDPCRLGGLLPTTSVAADRMRGRRTIFAISGWAGEDRSGEPSSQSADVDGWMLDARPGGGDDEGPFEVVRASPLLANIALGALNDHVHAPWKPGGTMSTPSRRARCGASADGPAAVTSQDPGGAPIPSWTSDRHPPSGPDRVCRSLCPVLPVSASNCSGPTSEFFAATGSAA